MIINVSNVIRVRKSYVAKRITSGTTRATVTVAPVTRLQSVNGGSLPVGIFGRVAL